MPQQKQLQQHVASEVPRAENPGDVGAREEALEV